MRERLDNQIRDDLGRVGQNNVQDVAFGMSWVLYELTKVLVGSEITEKF